MQITSLVGNFRELEKFQFSLCMRFKVRVLPGHFETLTVPAPEKENCQSPDESNHVFEKRIFKALDPTHSHSSVTALFNYLQLKFQTKENSYLY